jgi:hypothetical protein
MNKNILKIINNSYRFINRAVPILEMKKYNSFLHNNEIVKNLGNKSRRTFEGKYYCGSSCYILDYYLKCYGVKTKMILTENGYGKYKNDHCYLLYNDKYIIDPTYRQIFNVDNKYNKYKKHLFVKSPFVFVGTYKRLEKFFIKSNSIYENHYNSELDDELLNNWFSKKKDISYKLDSYKLLDINYTMNKGDNFIKKL